MGFFGNLFKGYSYHSGGKDARFEPTPRQWMLAADALLQKGDGNHIDLLGGAVRDASVTKGIRYNLKSSWEITDRESLMKTVEWLKDHGHRGVVTTDQETGEEIPGLLATYTESKNNLAKLQINLDAGSVEDEDEYAELEFIVSSIKEHGKNIEKNDFLAWDYVRALHILGWGYLAEYLTEDEAYDMMKPFAKKLQEQFNSWDEMSENYLLGRGYWNYDETDHDMLEEDRQKLLKDAGSPWVQIGFKSVKF